MLAYALTPRGVARIKRYCDRKAIPLDAALHEQPTDFSLRPVRDRILSLIRNGKVRELVVLQLRYLGDSLAEVLAIVGELHRLDVAVLAIADKLDTRSRTGKRMLGLLAKLGVWGRETHSRATKATLKCMRRAGAALGRAPYGWKMARGLDGKRTARVPVPEEQRVIVRALKLRAAGLSQEGIAASLQADGVPTRGGGPWTRRAVQCLLAAPPEA